MPCALSSVEPNDSGWCTRHRLQLFHQHELVLETTKAPSQILVGNYCSRVFILSLPSLQNAVGKFFSLELRRSLLSPAGTADAPHAVPSMMGEKEVSKTRPSSSTENRATGQNKRPG